MSELKGQRLNVEVARELGYGDFETVLKGSPGNTGTFAHRAPDGSETYFRVPDYQGDLGLAASLPVPENTWLEILISWGGRIAARYVPYGEVRYSGLEYSYSTGSSEAEVRCRAWLAWKQAD